MIHVMAWQESSMEVALADGVPDPIPVPGVAPTMAKSSPDRPEQAREFKTAALIAGCGCGACGPRRTTNLINEATG